MTPRTREIISLCAILIIVVFFCTFHIKESPPFWFDEGIYSQAALNLTDLGVVGFQIAPGVIVKVPQLSIGYPLIYPLAGVFGMFGVGVLQARLLMSLFILGTVLASYLLIRIIHGKTSALWMLFLLALFPPLYGTGKSVLGEVPGVFFFVLALLFLSHAIISEHNWKRYLRIIGVGLCMGLVVATKTFFITLIPAMVVLGIIYRKFLIAHIKEFTTGLISFAVPIVVWAFSQFESLDTLFSSLIFYSKPSGTNDVSVYILQNIQNMFLDVGPFMLAGTMMIWLVSIFIRWNKKMPIHPAESFSFVFCSVSILAFLRTAGYYRYLLPYQIISLLFFPNALKVLADVAFQQISAIKLVITRQVLLPTTFVIIGIFGGYQLLFNSWVADSYQSDKTRFWEEYFLNGIYKEPLFFYDVPEVAFFDHNRNYYQFINMAPATGITAGGESVPILVAGIPGTVIVQTDDLGAVSPDLFTKYQSTEEVYKYTILEKL